MKIYIAGPMTGLPDYNRKSFFSESGRLESLGHTVLNPATLPGGLTQGQYMDICFAMIRACEGVRLLHGWESSKGALAEIAYAEKLELSITRQIAGG